MAETLFIHKGAEWRLTVQGDDEIGTGEQWIAGTLAGSPELTAIIPASAHYQGVPAEDTPAPFLYYTWQTAEEDERTYENGLVATLIFLVAVVDQIETGADYPIVNAANKVIKALLEDSGGEVTGTAADGTVNACQRFRPWQMEESREV